MEGTSTDPELETRIRRIESKLVAIAARTHLTGLGILNINARQFNSQARDPQDQLQALQVAESNESEGLCYRRPDDFPRTLIEAISLRWDAKRLTQLLGFYNVKIFRPGKHVYTAPESPEEGEEDSHQYIDVDDEVQVEAHSKECFTYFICYIGLKRKVVENYLPSTERRQTE
ncbi:hypothetical protein TWF106_000239 [Orbilia oligospora]|uniref:Uncharacterized protein n=1 Tax=Orbilia oligospora TaxID=2813651 RepID=A0A7C8QUB1_ORBOL|nr:hypothetical protein TWF679_001935 [Orbilia oligospora]KAF3226497.1 hypothetical protein TWF106_000239 [Orbilia oligospora]